MSRWRTSRSRRCPGGSPSTATCTRGSTRRCATCECCSSGSSARRPKGRVRRRIRRTSPRCRASRSASSRRAPRRQNEPVQVKQLVPVALSAGVVALFASVAAAGGPPVWRAPANPLERAVAAKLVPERRESFLNHVHAHLDVFVNGKRARVPAGIGINIRDPGVQTFPTGDGTKAYGGISLCSKPCISPLHTHDDTGILHTESASPLPNTLGQFFTEWGVRLTRTCVGTYCH